MTDTTLTTLYESNLQKANQAQMDKARELLYLCKFEEA
jgi:hypothetical protein